MDAETREILAKMSRPDPPPMDFLLTEGQKLALEMTRALMDDDRPCVPGILTGYAGTGKTSMIKAIASEHGAPLVLAPTGKAALRVQEATGLTAGTIHKWLYRPIENSKTGEVEFRLKEHTAIERPFNSLIVVDEASMVGRDLWEDLWNVCQLLDLKIILVGDPFQLPPVEPKKTDEHGNQADAFSPLLNIATDHRAHLSEVTRQALDNPILRASMMIRESSRIDQALQLLNRVFRKDFDDKCMEVHRVSGMIICHKNETRHRINRTVRQLLGYTEALVDGEPLLVLRNNYEIDRFNGEVVSYQGWLNYDERQETVEDRWRKVSLALTTGVAQVDGREVLLVPEQVHGSAQLMTESVIAHHSRRYYADWYAPEGMEIYHPETRQYQGPSHLHANFGYGLTCHKAQGSECDTGIVLIENSTRPTTIEGRRWLYTATTRFKKTCYFTMEV